MSSYRRHATAPYAVARAKRHLRRHMLETPPRHWGGPAQEYVSPFAGQVFAEFKHRLTEMVPVAYVQDKVIGYRAAYGPHTLRCVDHPFLHRTKVPLTSDDLPDGGTCVMCGRDLLA